MKTREIIITAVMIALLWVVHAFSYNCGFKTGERKGAVTLFKEFYEVDERATMVLLSKASVAGLIQSKKVGE